RSPCRPGPREGAHVGVLGHLAGGGQRGREACAAPIRDHVLLAARRRRTSAARARATRRPWSGSRASSPLCSATSATSPHSARSPWSDHVALLKSPSATDPPQRFPLVRLWFSTWCGGVALVADRCVESTTYRRQGSARSSRA